MNNKTIIGLISMIYILFSPFYIYKLLVLLIQGNFENKTLFYSNIIMLIFVCIIFLSSIGLLFLKELARKIFTVALLIALVVSLLSGIISKEVFSTSKLIGLVWIISVLYFFNCKETKKYFSNGAS